LNETEKVQITIIFKHYVLPWLFFGPRTIFAQSVGIDFSPLNHLKNDIFSGYCSEHLIASISLSSQCHVMYQHVFFKNLQLNGYCDGVD
jgi:hypothetical protein